MQLKCPEIEVRRKHLISQIRDTREQGALEVLTLAPTRSRFTPGTGNLDIVPELEGVCLSSRQA